MAAPPPSCLPGTELEQEKAKAKTAQTKALELGERDGCRCRRLCCRGESAADPGCLVQQLLAPPCPSTLVSASAAKKARGTADEAKKALADCQAKLEAATAEASKAAAQVSALQAEKQRLQQRITALEAELAASRDAAAAAAAAARRGPAAREAGQRQVAEIQERAMAQLQQELKKAVQKRKLPEAAAAPADEAAAAQEAAPEAAAAAEAAAAEAPASKRTRVTPPAAEEAPVEPAAAEAEEQADEELAGMEEDQEAEVEQVGREAGVSCMWSTRANGAACAVSLPFASTLLWQGLAVW